MIHGLFNIYEDLHVVIEKFKKGEELNDTERLSLVQILELTKGNIIPTEKELNKYKEDIKELGIATPGSYRWNKVHPGIEEFERKYPQYKEFCNEKVKFIDYFGTSLGYIKTEDN